MDPFTIAAGILGLGVQFAKAYQEFKAASLQSSVSTPEEWAAFEAKNEAMLAGDEWKTDAQAGVK